MRVVVGTTPVLALNPNKNRTAWSVTMIPKTIEVSNTGSVFVGRGFQPKGEVGSPQQGEVLQQGAEIGEEQRFEKDTSVFKGQVWVVADTADQVVEVYEAYNENVGTSEETSA